MPNAVSFAVADLGITFASMRLAAFLYRLDGFRVRVGDVMAYLWVAIGSALGGMARYWCSGIAARLIGETFPWGTVFVNILGSFVIGVFAAMTAAEGRFLVAPEVRIFVMVGLCGGYTTFSSFSLQTYALWREGEWLWAGANSILSFVLCLAAVWLGHMLGEIVSR
jgi:fluoride exporter